jgi:hypothetical protein
MSDDLFRRHEQELGRFTDRRVRRFLRILDGARKQLQADISAEDALTAARAASLALQIDKIINQAVADMRELGPVSENLAKLAAAHAESGIAAVAGVRLAVAFDRLNTRLLQRFSENELKHVTGLVDIEKQRLKSVLFNRVGVRGENPRKVAQELAGPDGLFAKRFAHIENILRTETSTVYNEQATEAIKVVNKEHGLALNVRIVETIDHKRNHPISQVLNGMVQRPGEPFRVPVAKVRAVAAKLGKQLGGVLWRVENGHYIGERLPAHYRERGVMVATREEPPT